MVALKKTKSAVKSPSLKEESFSRSRPLNPEETFEENEAAFWEEVAEKSESLIAQLIEATLPISATPQVFNLEQDVDYRILLRDDLPNSYQDQEEYQTKIASQSWTSEDVEYVAQDLTCAYFEIVIKALVERLSDYTGFENTSLSSLGG